MARTSITIDHGLAQRLRRLKQDLSDAEGRVVSIPDVIIRLLYCWEQAHKEPGQ